MKYYTYRVVIALNDDDSATQDNISDWIVSQVEHHDSPYILVDSIIEEH